MATSSPALARLYGMDGDLAGYPKHMPISSTHLEILRPSVERHMIVETSEYEVVDIEGCSRDEVDAKLHAFEAWAS